AKAGAEQLPLFAVGIDLVNAASRPQDAGHEAVPVGHARQQMVFAPEPWHPRTGQRAHHSRLVPAHDIDGLAVAGEQDGVGAVLAAAAHFTQKLRLFESVAAVLRTDAVQTVLYPDPVDGGSFVDHDVKAVERPE